MRTTLFSLILAPVLVLASALVGVPSPALAHKVVMSTYVTGDDIEGEVGFSDGSMAADTAVTVATPDGRPLGETRTDADGFFTFTPTDVVDHVFRANLGAGHVAEATVAAADLPRSVRDGPGGGTAEGQTPIQSSAPVAAVTRADGPAGTPQTLSPALREDIALAVRDEVRPLRRALVELREKNDLQSILGGIGYIVGLFGVAFYLLGRRRLTKA